MEEDQEASRRYWSFVASKHGQALLNAGQIAMTQDGTDARKTVVKFLDQDASSPPSA